MSASYPLPKIRTYRVDANYSAYQYRFMKPVTSSDSMVTVAATKGERVIGVLMNQPTASKQLGEIAMIGGGALVKCSAAVAAGDMIVSDSSGYGIKPDAADQTIVAQALGDALASGDVIPVNMTIAKAYASQS